MKEAVAYCRVSSIGQVDGFGIDRQSEAIKACCASQGMHLKAEYHEEGVAGKLGQEDRPAFQMMVADLLGNGCRTVVVESLDRLARQYDIQQQLATYLASKQITLISANTGEDITAALMGDPMRRALVQIQGIFAELDKNMLVAKLKKGLLRKKELTGRAQGRLPYGMIEGEAGTLALMQSWRRDGMTYQVISAELNARGIKTRAGESWIFQTVGKILSR